METLLQQAIEITSEEYNKLVNPIFKGQTRLDDNHQYWLVVENNNILYKIHKSL